MAFAPAVAPDAFAAGATPSGGQFAAGAGAIAPTANGLSITQSTSRGIIDWQSFSIGQGNAVNIANGSGATLNRVTGGDISNIAGSLTSTGSVYVINPAGIVVMPSGQVVTTGSFVASTRDVSDSSFMAGGAQNFKGTSSGTVVNQGSITSTLGDVTLIGQSVTNSGQISAPNGTVGLAAGDDILLQPSSDPEIVIDAGTGDATNSGNIAAAQAELAAAGGNVYALATNNGGVIRATGSATKNGHVYLTAGGNVTVAGTVSATNADGSGGTVKAIAGNGSGILSVTGAVNVSAIAASGKGGTATLTGNTVNIGSTAIISANGGTDGGNIFIGGDRHGGTDPSVALSATPIPNAQYTTVSAGANIAADGGSVAGTLLGGAGNGGNVVVWSNISTNYAGAISAQGGAAGGNGGFVEVSGEQLAFTGTVSTLAPMGTAGTLLLDPSDVTIVSSTDNSGVSATTNDTVAGGTFTPTGTGNTADPTTGPQGTTNASYILNTTIDTALASNNVVINTGSIGDGNTGAGNIHFGNSGSVNNSNAAPIYWSSGFSLTLNAVGIIDAIGGSPTSSTGGYNPSAPTVLIDALGTGSIILNAGSGLAANSGTAITLSEDIVAHGGNITLAAQSTGNQVVDSGNITNSFVSSAFPGQITFQADIVRLGAGHNYIGSISTTGDVVVEPFTSGAIIVGNTNNGGGNSSQPADDPANTAILNNDSIGVITANTLIVGSTNVTNLSISSPSGIDPTLNNPPYLGILATHVSNLEFLTGNSTSNSVTQDAKTTISVGASYTGGLSVVTGGSVSLPDFLNEFGTIAIQAGGNVVVQGNTTNDSTGTLNIGTVGMAGTGYVVSGISAPGKTVTILNIGSTTQDKTSAANAITAGNLVLEGAVSGNYLSYDDYYAAQQTYSGTLNGSYTLNNTSNAISSIAGSVSSLSLTDNVSLTVAAGLSDNLGTLTQNSGNIIASTSFSGITGTGAITLVDNGTLTIASGAPIVTPGGDILLEDQTFTNNDGASALSASGTGDYWRVYSQDPRNDSDGALDTNSTTYASFVQYAAPNSYGDPTMAATVFTNANAVLTGANGYGNGTGNGFLYSVSPTVTESVQNSFSKVYDGNTNYAGSGGASETLSYNAQVIKVSGNQVTNLGAGGVADTVTLNKTASMALPQSNFYPSSNAGSYNLSTLPGVTVTLASAVDKNNVTVYGYSVSPNVSATATITPAPLTFTPVAASVQYNATTLNNANYSDNLSNYTISGYQNGQNATTAGLALSGSMAFNGATTTSVTNAGTYTQGVGTLTLTSTNSNYSLNFTNPIPNNYVITQAPVTVIGSKVYDGSATASYTTFTSPVATNSVGTPTGVFAADAGNVTITQSGSATLGSANAGSYSTANGNATVSNGVTLNTLGITLSGSAAGNYYLAGATYTVTKEPLTISAVTQTKAYDSTTTSTGTPTITAGALQGGDTLTGLSQAYGSPNVMGTNGSTLSVNGGYTLANSNDYTVTLATAPGTITQAPVTVIGSKVYDGSATASYTTFTSPVATNSVGTPTGVFAADAGNVTITQSGSATLGSANAGSYSTANGNATVSNGVTLNTLGITLSGSAAGNYYLAGATYTVTQHPVAIASGSKTYDGTNVIPAADITGLTGLQGDTFGGTGPNAITITPGTSGSTSSANANTYSNFNLGTLTLSGNDAGNYTLAAGTFTINTAPLTITASAQTRVYGPTSYSVGSQTTHYTTTGTLYTNNGVPDSVTSVTLSVPMAATLSTTGVTGANPYAITPSAAVGTGLSNYNITYVAGTAAITPAPLTITANSTTKTYGSTVTFAGTEFTTTPLVNGETVGSATLASAGAVANAGVAGSPYSITVSAATGGTFNPTNYNINYVPGTLTVNQAPAITITANNQTKTYGATANLGTTAFMVAGLVGGDTVSGVTLTSAGTPAAADAGAYNIVPSNETGVNLANYAGVNYVNGTLTVNPALLTVTGTKVYDNTTGFATNQLTLTGGVNGQTVTLTGGTGTSASPNVNTYPNSPLAGLAITVSGGTGNALSSNYSLPGTGTLTITPATVTPTTTSTSASGGKVYDGTTVVPAATITSLSGLASGDALGGDLTITGTGSITSPNVGTYTGAAGTFSVAGLTLGGAAASNYILGAGTYTVTQAPAITITASPQSKTYGTVANLGTTAFTTTGLVGGDTVGGVTLTSAGTPATANAGAYSIVPSNETGGTFNPANYAGVNYANGVLTVNPATLLVSANPETKVYGSADPTLTYTETGLANGDPDPVTGALTRTPGETVAGGPYAITLGTLTSTNGNYTVSYAGNNLTITAKPITITGSKSYDGTTTAAASTFAALTSQLVGGDAVTLAGAGTLGAADAGNYSSANSGTAGLPLTGLSLTGGAAGNYALIAANYTVNPEAIVITAVPTTKTYDGTPSSPGTPVVTSGIIYASDPGTLTQTYGGPNAGTNLTLTPTGTFANSVDYTVTYVPVITGVINPAPLTISAVNTTKVYDGTTVSNGIPTVTGLVGSDTITPLTQSYNSRNVLGTNGSTLTVTPGYTIADGNGGGNYTVVVNTSPGTITPEAITVIGTPVSKLYDGTPRAPGVPTVVNGTIYGPDTGVFTETYGGPNAGTNLTLTPTGTINDGNGGGNYVVTFVPVTTGTISPLPVILSGTRVYDGTTNAAASILTFSNDLDGSNLTLSGSGTLIAAAVGLEPISSFTGLALGGSAAGNYTLIGAIGNVQVTPDPPATPIQVMVPLNQTASGVSEVPSDFTIYDGGILYVKPTQNGIVTGTIATIDGQTYQPDNQLGCTLGPTGACVENGIAPSAGKAPAGAR